MLSVKPAGGTGGAGSPWLLPTQLVFWWGRQRSASDRQADGIRSTIEAMGEGRGGVSSMVVHSTSITLEAEI